MTHLYTCRSAGDQYRITKLDTNLDVESSYLCSADECQCPGFERRGQCRHLEMLPRFIHRGHIGDDWALDFDRLGWEQIRLTAGGQSTIEIEDTTSIMLELAEAKPFARRF